MMLHSPRTGASQPLYLQEGCLREMNGAMRIRMSFFSFFLFSLADTNEDDIGLQLIIKGVKKIDVCNVALVMIMFRLNEMVIVLTVCEKTAKKCKVIRKKKKEVC